MTGQPAILLDRDGTINVDTGYVGDVDAVVLENGALDGLVRLAAMGLPLAVVTNQSGVARGYFPLTAVHGVNGAIDEILRAHGVVVAGWFICPHGPAEDCECRKPSPGLAQQARDTLGIDLAASFVIGDKPGDIILADSIGARGILVMTGQGAMHREWAERRGTPVCRDLTGAAVLIEAWMDVAVWPEPASRGAD